jgi:hypothetical protein
MARISQVRVQLGLKSPETTPVADTVKSLGPAVQTSKSLGGAGTCHWWLDTLEFPGVPSPRPPAPHSSRHPNNPK